MTAMTLIHTMVMYLKQLFQSSFDDLLYLDLEQKPIFLIYHEFFHLLKNQAHVADYDTLRQIVEQRFFLDWENIYFNV